MSLQNILQVLNVRLHRFYVTLCNFKNFNLFDFFFKVQAFQRSILPSAMLKHPIVPYVKRENLFARENVAANTFVNVPTRSGRTISRVLSVTVFLQLPRCVSRACRAYRGDPITSTSSNESRTSKNREGNRIYSS